MAEHTEHVHKFELAPEIITINHHEVPTSRYSSLADALQSNIYGKPEYSITTAKNEVDITSSDELKITYNERQHYSTYSTLMGVLG